tara:strand:+ start:107 stop:229 length:123 start_codon:yes stop_codon:yes gene_type:complete
MFSPLITAKSHEFQERRAYRKKSGALKEAPEGKLYYLRTN